MKLPNPEPDERKQIARKIFDGALAAADPAVAVERSVTVVDEMVSATGLLVSSTAESRDIFAVAIGKAAYSTAAGLARVLGPRLKEGIAVGVLPRAKPEMIELATRWTLLAGSHPLPTEESFAAGRAIIDFVRHADRPDAAIIFLISGGGSAMVEWPVDPRITVRDLATINALLLASGVPIYELNIVRRALSAIKGGRLASFAPQSLKVGLIVSDTNPGDEASVASGPTFPAPAANLSAADILRHHGLWEKVPPVIREVIVAGSSLVNHQPPPKPLPNRVLLNSEDAIAGAHNTAADLGFQVVVSDGIVEQEIARGCGDLLERFSVVDAAKPICLLSAGEFRTPVNGDGWGGRSTETALRLALMLAKNTGSPSTYTALLAGTDGIDGNCPAAGAVIDETSLSRARSLGHDPRAFLDRSDSFSFFDSLDDAIVTGPTGTNVRDLRILLGWS
jgi:hydroxypyruvate reductase